MMSTSSRTEGSSASNSCGAGLCERMAARGSARGSYRNSQSHHLRQIVLPHLLVPHVALEEGPDQHGADHIGVGSKGLGHQHGQLFERWRATRGVVPHCLGQSVRQVIVWRALPFCARPLAAGGGHFGTEYWVTTDPANATANTKVPEASASWQELPPAGASQIQIRSRLGVFTMTTREVTMTIREVTMTTREVTMITGGSRSVQPTAPPPHEGAVGSLPCSSTHCSAPPKKLEVCHRTWLYYTLQACKSPQATCSIE